MQKVFFGQMLACVAIAALSACGDSSSSASSSPSTGSESPSVAPAVSSATATTTVKLSAASYSVPATTGKAVLAVERVGSSGTTAVHYTTSDGSGSKGVDYTASTGTLTWADGDTSVKKIYVPVGSKASGKTFKVALAPADESVKVASPNVATVTVTAPAEPLPPAAEQAGYKTVTFGPALKMGENWFNMTFFGWGGHGGANNSDGTVTISGKGSGTISTAEADESKPNDWKGIAFGGGAYFEAVFSFTNADEKELDARWPAFWADDIECTAHGEATSQTQWPGQAKGFRNCVETDIFEYDVQDLSAYGIQIHNWYGFNAKHLIKDTRAWTDPITVPKGFKWNETHKYGFLWVPATASSHGYAQAYLDDAPVGEPVYWNKYDPKQPPAPLLGTSAFSVMDTRHMALIMDTGPKNPMTVHSVTVWQASKEHNITQ